MTDSLSQLLKSTFLVVGALFPIVNPIGNTPIFLSLTRGLSAHGRMSDAIVEQKPANSKSDQWAERIAALKSDEPHIGGRCT